MTSSTATSFAEILSEDRVLPFAHRGAGMLAPENTMAAFAAAVGHGYRLLETDVQASSDGEVFVFHDKDLHRLTGHAGDLESLTAAQISKLRINDNHPIPQLSELLEEHPNALLNIDAKTPHVARLLGPLIRRMGAGHRVLIGSFSDRRIRQTIAGFSDPVCHSAGTLSVVKFMLSAQLRQRPGITAQCLQIPTRQYGVSLVKAKTLDHARKHGLKTHVWTINQARQMHELIDLGVDGIMTDDCVTLKNVMLKRGLW